ncbi:MAG TPA: DNA helicase, partial [Rhodopila sp.]|nr:DNA helicase [Rhodopila sp.]
HIEGFTFIPDPAAVGDEKKLVLRAARRSLREEMPRRVDMLEAAADESFGATTDNRITWEGAPVGKLMRGPTALRPRLHVLDSEFLDGAARERVRVRLQAWLDSQIRADLAPLFEAEALAQSSADLRGPLHRLVESLGLIPGIDAETWAPALRPRLRAIGVRSGRFALFMPALMKPRAAAMRVRLWAAQRGIPLPPLPAAALVSVPAGQPDWPPGFAAMAGWIEAGPILLRLDIAEKIAGELGYQTRHGPAVLPGGLPSRLAIKADLLPAVLRSLGFRVLPGGGLGPDQQGPPAPPMIMPLRRRRPFAETPKPVPVPAGPFAKLAALRR